MNMQEPNQPSFQAGRLVVIYHAFINPRSAKTASTNRITGAAARGQEEQEEAHNHHAACLLPGAELHQEGVEAFAFQRHSGSLCMALMFAR